MIADDIAGMEVYFENEAGEEVEVKDNKLNDIFKKAHDKMLFCDIIKNVVVNLELSGNAFLIMHKGIDDNSEKSMHLRFIPSSSMQLHRGNTNTPVRQYFVTDSQELGKVEFHPNEVIHIRKSGSYDSYVGVGAVQSASTQLSTEFDSDGLNNVYMNNCGKPSFLVQTPPMTVSKFKETEAKIKDGVSGSNFGNVVVMNGIQATGSNINMDVTDLSSSKVDMQYSEGKEYNRRMILDIFGIPEDVLGSPKNSNRATVNTSYMIYHKRLNKIIANIENAINSQFMDMYFPNVRFRIRKFDTTDQKIVLEQLNNNLISYNTARERLCLPIVDGEDEVFVKDTLVSPPMDNYEDSSSENTKKWTTKNLEQAEQDITKGKEFQLDYFKSVYGIRERAIDDNYTMLSHYYERLGKRFIKALNKKNTEIEEFFQQELGLFNDLYDEMYLSTIIKASNNMSLHMNSTVRYDVNNPAVQNALLKANNVVKQLYHTLTTEMKEVVAEGIQEGVTTAELTRTIKKEFEEYSGWKAERIARTETGRAMDYANNEVYKDMGVTHIDVIGCTGVSVLRGGKEPANSGYCGAKNVPIDEARFYHPNHLGVEVPSNEV